MHFKDFLPSHPIFSGNELSGFMGKNKNRWTLKAILAHHRKQGHIVLIRRGLYAAVPHGSLPDACPLDPYLLASKMADDAILAYHTALEVYGKAHSVFERFLYVTKRTTRPVTFRSYRFMGVRPPVALTSRHNEETGVKTVDRSGVSIHVTSLERTLVDILNRPDLGGGWEEIWRSLESVEFFDLDKVIKYVLLLENATTVAKVGFYLNQHRDPLMVEDHHLKTLKKYLPRRPHYMDSSRRRTGRLVSAWNLIVPAQIVDRSWEEAS